MGSMNMKFTSVLLALSLVIALTTPIWAQDEEYGNGSHPNAFLFQCYVFYFFSSSAEGLIVPQGHTKAMITLMKARKELRTKLTSWS